jgi:hypothetical protein
MPNDDLQLESFLREFRPTPPGPLPELESTDPGKNIWRLRALAAAAIFLLAFGIWRVSWVQHKSHLTQGTPSVISRFATSPNPAFTLGTLQKLAETNPDRLNVVLDSDSNRLLPDVEKSQGALGVLARQ